MKQKNNYFKKILSLVLVLLMIFNINIISYADNNTNDGLLISPNPNSLISTNTNNNYNEIYTNDELVIINEIYASGIMKGTDEGFLGHKSLTRAEAITIILRMKGISDTIINSYSSSNNSNNYDGNFIDVPKTHWAYNYINYAYDLDLVNGVSQGIYEPDREVTIVEFLAMCIRALNMDKLVLADTTYEWPINYLNYAIELNLLDNVYTNYQSNATRLDSASIVINTINTPMWEKDKVSTNKEVSYALNNNYFNTILFKTLKLINVSFMIDSINTKDNTIKVTTCNDNVTNDTDVLSTLDNYFKSSNYDLDINTNDNVNDVNLLNNINNISPHKIYYGLYNVDTKKLVGLWIKDDDSIKFLGINKKYNSSKKEIELLVDNNSISNKDNKDNTTNVVKHNLDIIEKTYKVADDAMIYLNDDTDGISLLTLDNSSDYYLKDIYGELILNDKNEITKINGYYLEGLNIVDHIENNNTLMFGTNIRVLDTINNGSVFSDTSSLKYSKDKNFIITKNDKRIKFSDIKEGDIIGYFKSKNNSNTINIFVFTNVFEVNSIYNIDNSDISYRCIDGRVKSKSTRSGSELYSTIRLDSLSNKTITGYFDDIDLGSLVTVLLNRNNNAYGYVINRSNSNTCMITSIREVRGKYTDKEIEVSIKVLNNDNTSSNINTDTKDVYKELIVDLDKTAENFMNEFTNKEFNYYYNAGIPAKPFLSDGTQPDDDLQTINESTSQSIVETLMYNYFKALKYTSVPASFSEDYDDNDNFIGALFNFDINEKENTVSFSLINKNYIYPTGKDNDLFKTLNELSNGCIKAIESHDGCISYGKLSTTITLDDNPGYNISFVDKDSNIYQIKEKDTNECKIDKITYEDLKSFEDDGYLSLYLLDVNNDSGRANTCIIYSPSARVHNNDSRLSLVTEIADSVFNDKYNDAKEITCFDMDGKEHTYYYVSDLLDDEYNGDLNITFNNETMYDLVIDNYDNKEVIVDIIEHDEYDDKIETEVLDRALINNYKTRLKLSTTDIADISTYNLTDRLLVIKKDNDDNYSKSTLSEINIYDTDLDSFYDNDYITSLVLYTDEEEEDVIIAIVFADNID